MAWLQGIREASSSSPGFTPRVYREAGRVYMESLSGGSLTDAHEIPGIVVGYVGTDDGPWYPGKKGQLYDPDGRLTGEFELDDPNKRDLGETLAMATILGIATAGAFQAFGGLAGSGGAAATAGEAGATLSTAATAGTASTAGATGGIGATLSSALGAVKTALGITSAVNGLNGSSGTTPPPATSFVPITATPQPGTLAGIDPLWLLAGAAVVVFALLES